MSMFIQWVNVECISQLTLYMYLYLQLCCTFLSFVVVVLTIPLIKFVSQHQHISCLLKNTGQKALFT